MSQRTINPREVILEYGDRLSEVPAPHIGLSRIEGRADFEADVAECTGNVVRPRPSFNARIKLAAPIVHERPRDVDCRQPLAILNRGGQGLGLGEIAIEPVEVGDGYEDRSQLQSDVDSLSNPFVDLAAGG